MYRLIQKFHLDRYLSSKLVLLIDSVVSVGSTLLAYLLVRSLVVSSVFTVRYGLLLLLGSLIFSVLSFNLFGTQRTIIRHTTLREMWKLVAAVALKDALLFVYVFWVLPHDAQTGLTAASLGFMIDILLTLFLLLSHQRRSRSSGRMVSMCFPMLLRCAMMRMSRFSFQIRTQTSLS